MEPQKYPEHENIKILIVDDDPIVREVIKSFIASYGFSFATASDGLEALEKLKEGCFYIVITDINMPNMDGMELLALINASFPHIGVIIITGLSEEYTYVDVIKAGAIDFMTKPFNGQELLAKLQRVIREQTLFRELEKKSISDSLTDLYNRRHFDTKLKEELLRATRQKYPIYLALIDVDSFKGYNDTYGHQAGDNLLAAFGQILLSCARKGVDWVFRYGGDEFAIILTQTTGKQALKIVERINTTYKEYNFGETSLSIGMAEFSRDNKVSWDEDIDKFIERVDQALYKAKKTGKNHIVQG